MRSTSPFMSLFIVMFLSGIAGQESAGPEGGSSRGATLYSQYCSACHGTDGRGDGELEYLLFPKPRDFTWRLFKLRSTPSGVVPTNGDLHRTVATGMPGTAMPSFRFLRDDEIDAIVNHVKRLGNFEGEHPTPVTAPRPLPYSDDLVDIGKQVYQDLGCAQCHGDRGKGDGPSAKTLMDDRGFPIRVRDFTQGIYLGGGEPEDLYLRFVTGMDGTPMPSYLSMADEMGESESERQRLIWGLVHYVKSLEVEPPERQFLPPADGILMARKVSNRRSDSDLLSPLAADWRKAPSYSIPISRLWQRDRTNVNHVNVKVLYNKKYLAMMMEWSDESNDAGTYRIQDFQDAAAVQFSLTGQFGFHGMGSKSNPVNIWFWKSEWQFRKDQDASLDIGLAYANRASDADVETYPASINEVAYLPGRDANNPLSVEEVITPVENVNAVGPQTLTSRPPDEQNIAGRGIWDGGKWQVVLIRTLKTDSEKDVQLKGQGLYPVAFAVWNGSEGDRDGQKMVSTWYKLELK